MCGLDESSQSSASTGVSNDSNHEHEDDIAQKSLLLHLDDDYQSYCSIDDDSIIKKEISNGDDNVSLDFIVHAKSMTVASTFDVLEAPNDNESTKLICGNNDGVSTASEIEIPESEQMLDSEDESNNHELSLYHADEHIEPTEMISTEPLVPTIRKLSLLDQLDIMFEKLCFTNTVVCDDLAMSYGCPSNNQNVNTLTRPFCDTNYYQSSMDTIITILGCNSPSSTYEYACFTTFESHLLSCCGGGGDDDVDGPNTAVATNTVIPPPPHAHPIRMKVSRRGRSKKRRSMQQLLLERGRTTPEFTTRPKLRRTHSLSSIPCSEQPKRQWHNPTNSSSSFDITGYFYVPKESNSQAISRILQDNDNMDGYDSDPCLPYSKPLIQRATSPRSVLVDAPQSGQWNSNKFWYNTNLLRETVEITMNSTWNLFWMHNDKPIQVQVWIEPGTILQNRSVMVEPCLMWRCLSSSSTSTGTTASRASISSSTPMSLRLLQICRVRPVTTGPPSTGKDVPTMCRMSTSLFVRTIYHDTFYFQASSIPERDSIVHQWKVTIARLATLAVLEDTPSLVHEFFLDPHQNQHSYKVK